MGWSSCQAVALSQGVSMCHPHHVVHALVTTSTMLPLPCHHVESYLQPSSMLEDCRKHRLGYHKGCDPCDGPSGLGPVDW
ncbi:hypothetical protein V6N13_061952 [Hibiscus sabdariffa]|uniref:Uncharacterized protein n=1 Tax=Hibiscus sabdariffa TaxID=183260 RepID=A0ABR2PEZ9_9ROSI